MPKKSDSAFASRIYALLRQVPAGYVTTYGDLAQAAGSHAYRAVGQVLRCNPYAPEVPCHRVVASDGSLHGFNGSRAATSLQRKKSLLSQEGLSFQKNKVLNFSQHRWSFRQL